MNTVFERPGHTNTEQSLAILRQGIERYGADQVVVASTRGDTGLAAARLLQNKGVTLVVDRNDH